jgi:hypothetical protein
VLRLARRNGRLDRWSSAGVAILDRTAIPLMAGDLHDAAMVDNVLVVACQTIGSDALLDAMCDTAARRQTKFTLLIPGGRQLPDGLLAAALERQRRAGLDVDVQIGDHDPIVAVRDAWAPARYDAVIVSTLPDRSSRWLKIGLPFRITHLTGALVKHVSERPSAASDDRIAVAMPR